MQTAKQYKPLETPWGLSQTVEYISGNDTGGATGVLFVTTASHGGYYVPRDQLHKITAERRAYAARWSGSEQWYEEDCAAAIIPVSFLELFDAERVRDAQDYLTKLDMTE